jgi:hypothetical protein
MSSHERRGSLSDPPDDARRIFGASGPAIFSGLVVQGGRVWVAGELDGTSDFGDCAVDSTGDRDVILAAYDAADGSAMGCRHFDGTGSQQANGMWATADGLVLRLSSSGRVSLGGGDFEAAAGGPQSVVGAFEAAAGTAHRWSRVDDRGDFDTRATADNDTVYFAEPHRVWALDELTGEEQWFTTRSPVPDPAFTVDVEVAGDRLYTLDRPSTDSELRVRFYQLL